MLKRIICAMFMSLFATFSNAQNPSFDITKLDPNIVAAAHCNGAMFANSMSNFETGVLDEHRARVMTRTIGLSFFLTAIKYQPASHIQEYSDQYEQMFSIAYDEIYEKLSNETFDWDEQLEIDKCAARIFEPLTDIPIDKLRENGVDDYFSFVQKMNKMSDERFDYILKLMDAMK